MRLQGLAKYIKMGAELRNAGWLRLTSRLRPHLIASTGLIQVALSFLPMLGERNPGAGAEDDPSQGSGSVFPNNRG